MRSCLLSLAAEGKTNERQWSVPLHCRHERNVAKALQSENVFKSNICCKF